MNQLIKRMSEKIKHDTFILSMISGATAGTSVDLILFPLDTVKTRLQSKVGFWKSGGFKGIYSGLPSILLGGAPTSALFFTTYEMTKLKLSQYEKMNKLTPTLSQIIAANLGEVAACFLRVPVDVIKQIAQSKPNMSTYDVFKHVIKNDGFLSLYRAYLTTVLREIPFGTIQYPLWEYLKTLVIKYSKDKKCEPLQSAICGSVAGGVAAGLTTPLDVDKILIILKKNVKESSERRKIIITLNQIIKENGIKGLFAGISPRVTMISFGGFIFFGIYEETRKLINRYVFSETKFKQE